MKTIIQTPTPNYELSCNFYKKIGYAIDKIEGKTYLHSKGVTIELNEDRFSRAGLKCFGNNWTQFLIDCGLMPNATKTPNGFLITSPCGCPIYLEDMPKQIPQSEKTPLIGNFAGFSLETNQMEESSQFWALFGYKQTMGNIDQGWLALSNDEGFSISLMKYQYCPHIFLNPSLSYFNGTDNLSIIKQVKEAGIAITEEITHFNPEGIVDNIIIQDPAGLGFFIFSD